MAEAIVTWVDGMHFEGTAGGHTIQMDAPPPYGDGTGMGPMTMLLAAMGGCTGMDIVDILKKQRQEITELSIRVTGERAADYPKVYETIEVVYTVRGHKLSPEAVERAVRLSEDKYCSVGIMLGKTAKVTTRTEIIEEE